MEAYQVLSDPEKRAAYDVDLHSERQVRWKIFDQDDAAVGKAGRSLQAAWNIGSVVYALA